MQYIALPLLDYLLRDSSPTLRTHASTSGLHSAGGPYSYRSLPDSIAAGLQSSRITVPCIMQTYA